MRPPETLGDWIFFLVLASIVFAMGVLSFIYPLEPIPEQRGAFVEHSGLLEEVLARESGRRLSLVKFRLIKDPTVYESRAPRIHKVSAAWRDRQTTLLFYTLQKSEDPGTVNRPRLAYGLVADGLVTRSLEADIRYTNAMVSPWAGVLAIGIGTFGYLVAGLVWWRKRAA